VERIAVNLENINDSGDYFILQRILKSPENFKVSGEFQNLRRISKSLENIKISGALQRITHSPEMGYLSLRALALQSALEISGVFFGFADGLLHGLNVQIILRFIIMRLI